ncbi:MAG: hypothetical protein Sapg2KO_04560 [Saprospiraceae bacterium]
MDTTKILGFLRCLGWFSILFYLSACESAPQNATSLDASKLIQNTQYQFQQPLTLRENLLAERGFNSIDSVQWQQLDLQKKTTYNPASSYYILGKLAPLNQLFSTLFILEDHPEFSRSWTVTYNTMGQSIDQLLVYYQKQPGPLRTSGYLNENQITLTLEGSLKKRYRLSEAGTFILLAD